MFTNTIFHSLVDPKDITVNFSSKLAVPSPPLLIYARLTEFPAADKNEEKKNNTELMHKFGGKAPVARCNQVTLFLLAEQTFSADSGLPTARK